MFGHQIDPTDQACLALLEWHATKARIRLGGSEGWRARRDLPGATRRLAKAAEALANGHYTPGAAGGRGTVAGSRRPQPGGSRRGGGGADIAGPAARAGGRAVGGAVSGAARALQLFVSAGIAAAEEHRSQSGGGAKDVKPSGAGEGSSSSPAGDSAGSGVTSGAAG